jgi:hypothetical protein
VQGHPDRTRRFAEDVRHRGGVEPGDDPQRDRFGLVLRQAGQQRDRGAERHPVQHQVLDLAFGGQLKADVGGRAGAAAGTGPGRVDGPVPPDREQPAAELLLAAAEPAQVADHLKPRLAGHVVRVSAAEHPEIAEQAGLQLPPQLEEPGLVARLGERQRAVQLTRFRHHCASQVLTPRACLTWTCVKAGGVKQARRREGHRRATRRA